MRAADTIVDCSHAMEDLLRDEVGMLASEDEQMKRELVELNQRIARMEQKRDLEALDFFNLHLADHLVFRPARSVVMSKYGPRGFMSGLTAPSRFIRQCTEGITVDLLGIRALVTLVVVGVSRFDGSVQRRRNIRLFTRVADRWLLEFWYDQEMRPEGGESRATPAGE